MTLQTLYSAGRSILAAAIITLLVAACAQTSVVDNWSTDQPVNKKPVKVAVIVVLPDALTPKLEAFWAYKRRAGEGLSPDAPLFCNQSRERISKRRVQHAFRCWQVKAGFDRLYPLHALRHTAVTNVYRASRDLFLAQRFTRHVSPLTTIVYTHVCDEELMERVRELRC